MSTRQGKSPAQPTPAPREEQPSIFPLVGVGASAGGLESFTKLLSHLPAQNGMAFIFVQHLEPTYPSHLTELLSKQSPMPIVEARDGMLIRPDHTYVIPENVTLTVADGRIHLTTRDAQSARHSIDDFLTSLANDDQFDPVGIILSGTGADGTAGLRAIHAVGGLTIAQTPSTAAFDGMPQSAIAAGIVRRVLDIEQIADELRTYSAKKWKPGAAPQENTTPLLDSEAELQRVFRLLSSLSGIDFTHYKRTTTLRRIGRRMALTNTDSLSAYAERLKTDTAEANKLQDELLIHVTSFFRDPEVFEALKSVVFPQLFAQRTPRDPIRIWVPGCATGEEAYSILMTLLEFLDEDSPPIQVFGTDVSEAQLEVARAGVYPESIAEHVSPERLRRFFAPVPGGYRISKSVRDCCVFARQNILRDPPFSRLDLISCRNVLIYLSATLQKKVLPTFHYALKPNGALLLGTSETVGAFAELFSLTEKRHKIYRKKSALPSSPVEFTLSELSNKAPLPKVRDRHLPADEEEMSEADRIVMNRYAPAGVIVNADFEIVRFRGQTAPFLEFPTGAASLNVLRIARAGLALELRSALFTAKRDEIPVRKEGIHVLSDGLQMGVNLEVIPLARKAGTETPFFLVLFEKGLTTPATPLRAKRRTKAGTQGESQVQVVKLTQELAATKEYLQSLIDEHDAAVEELRSAHEEAQSSNEELQSINEELETAKEELQSTNEELTTVNEELHGRNVELARVNNDLLNLLASTNIAIVMLGSDLRIRRFTPMAEKVLNIIPSDVGRPLTDLNTRVVIPDLPALIRETTDSLTMHEREVEDRQGHWYSLRVRPYRTAENRIEGVVMTFLDIDLLKRSLLEVAAARRYAETIVDTVRGPLIVLNADLTVQTANRSFYEYFHVDPTDTEGKLLYSLGNGQWNIPALRKALEELLPTHGELRSFVVEHDFERLGHRKLLLNARRLAVHEQPMMILLSIEDAS